MDGDGDGPAEAVREDERCDLSWQQLQNVPEPLPHSGRSLRALSLSGNPLRILKYEQVSLKGIMGMCLPVSWNSSIIFLF